MDKGALNKKNILYQASIIDICLKKQISQENGAKNLEISSRQFRRKIARYKQGGVFALEHRLKGQASNHSINIEMKEKIMNLVKSEKYEDFQATLLSQILEKEEKLFINPFTLRNWLIKEKIHIISKQKVKKLHPLRQRKEAFGEMLQIDGSFHEWFESNTIKEERKACLLNLIDDHSSINSIMFDKQETMDCACKLLWDWIEKYGIPLSIYCDRRNMYVSSNEYDSMHNSKGFFKRMCDNLGIQIIAANSPQAKGRVERSNKTHQDRLIKLMKLKNISKIEETIKYIKDEYMPEHNERYAFKKNPETKDAHRDKPTDLKLDDVCYIEETRKINNDWTISYKGEIIQLYGKSKNLYEKYVLVRKTLNGEIKILYRGVFVEYKKVA